jgi:predicted molibdopterin-dependent oxidoreductase YjgC
VNPEVNGYWMCDIGRFDYHWIEGDDRLRRPLVRDAAGVQQPATWSDLMPKLRDRLTAAGNASPESVRFLLSAHASHEELFLFTRLTGDLMGNAQGAVTVSWKWSPKEQPEGTKFKVPAADAPNVNGARLFGLVPGGVEDPQEPADIAGLKSAVESGRVAALYVFDPGPAGSIGDVSWILEARAAGRLPLLAVQAVVATELTRAADFVLPGASYVEKEASYTNEQGRLQGTARAMAPPGDAMDDWQIITNLGRDLGLAFEYSSASDVRRAISERFAGNGVGTSLAALRFGQAMPARHWLQASNPSERWKWDFMFQDLPPVKGAVDPESLPLPPGMIPLKVVK